MLAGDTICLVPQGLSLASVLSTVRHAHSPGRICRETGRKLLEVHGTSGCLSFADRFAQRFTYRWLFKLFLGMDANFRLKRKKVSSDTADPGLNNGYAYFVNESEYKAHLAAHDKPSATLDDTNKHCNTHDAIKLANIKGSVSLASSGVATVDCSRHEMKRPCSIGDLQKGER